MVYISEIVNDKMPEVAEEEIKIAPEDDPILYKETGNEAFKNQEWDEAVKHYTKAIQLGEKHKELPVFLKNRAACYLKLEEFEKAERDCTKALEISPKDPKALYRRCQALEALLRYEEAYRDARIAWEAEPNNKTLQPILERLHLITQERLRENAQTSNKVAKMFELAFNFELADVEKRKTAMSNLVVLAREKAGAEVMYAEHVLQKIGRLVKVEKNTEIIVNAIRVVDHLCTKSVDRTKGVIKELGIPWFIKMLNTSDDDRILAIRHCMQTVLNSFSGMENHEESKPDKDLVEANKADIDFLVLNLVHAVNDPILSGRARDTVIELLTRNIHYKHLDFAERVLDVKGLARLMDVCSELEEYTYESAIPITQSSRAIASVCLARLYENMWYDAIRNRFMDQISDYVRDKLIDPSLESKVRVTVAMTALLNGPLQVGNTLVSKEGILHMILAMASTDDLLQQKVACECLIAAASKKDKAKSLVETGMSILKGLYHSKNDEIRVRALVGLCKLGSAGGTDASIRLLAEGSTSKLAEACRRFLIKPGKDKDIRRWAAEGLSYLTLDADVKEKLIEDKPALRALIDLAKTEEPTVLYGVVTTLVNLCNAYEKQELMPELIELAKYAKHHVPEEHELDDYDFVAKRCVALTNEGVTTALVALAKAAESNNSKEMICRVFNALAQEADNRGKIVQQGGAKALLPMSLEGTPIGKRQAGQALSRLGITINPEQAFPGQRSLEVVRPLLNQLHPDCTALENFEAMMALCNLAQMSESVRKRIIRESGLPRIEHYINEDHLMLCRAAMQCVCNLCMSEDVVKLHEKVNDRVKLVCLMCVDEDEETAVAASGALAILTSTSEKCCERVMQYDRWLEVFRILLANPSPSVQHRGVVAIFNVVKAKKEFADRIFESDISQMLYGVTQLNDERRAKAMEIAQQVLNYAEKLRIIEENKDIASIQMPDPFKQPKAEDVA